ncbi:carbohydrate esterase family 8 protein [Hypoxylon sp. FL1857]|nr:carbohydrate esterase family 8 protein [Hypoxylon sp. FL1857]
MLVLRIALVLGHLLGFSALPASGTHISSTASTTTIESTTTASSICGAHPTDASKAPAGAVVVDSTNSTTGAFSSLAAALASLPGDSSCQTVFLLPGTYNEQVTVNRPGQTVIIGYTAGDPGKGYSGNRVTVSYSRGLSISPLPVGHSNSETAVVSTASSNIAFYNINFINPANLDGGISNYVALAGSTYGNHIGFYGCSFIGWQDTLLTGSTNGYQYYESCYIEGAIDFIWGYSAAYFKGCTIAAKRKSSCITAHSRKDDTSIGVYVFDQCIVTAVVGYASTLESGVYLGRPYSAYAKVIYKNSYLDSVVHPAGWKNWSATDPRIDHVTFAEFNNSGPGNWENNAAARQGFGHATLLTSDSYPLTSVMDSTSWIDSTYGDSISLPLGLPAPRAINPSSTNPSYPSSTAPEADSTVPADGDYIVSKSPIKGKTVYSSFAEVIAAIQGISSKQVVTVFAYPGIYKEQIVFNRSGTTIFRGYSEDPSNYAQNQVVLQNSHGVDTQADQSNSDSATLYSRAKYLQLYNINLNNVFGQIHNYASLGFASGNNGYTSFYGCQITGNQDTFDLNKGTSVFAYNTLVEGSIDFIWGAGSAYFLNSTLVPNTNGGSIAAMKRASSTESAGLVFDQCTVASVQTVSAGSFYLGRPYNNYSRVAYIKTYLDDSISSAGWSVWSKTNPQTGGVLFGEYHNYGPGATTTGRAAFSQQLSDADAVQFQLANFFSNQGTSWYVQVAVYDSPI